MNALKMIAVTLSNLILVMLAAPHRAPVSLREARRDPHSTRFAQRIRPRPANPQSNVKETTMTVSTCRFHLVALLALAAYGAGCASYATDKRVDATKQDVDDVELRVADLEALVTHQAAALAALQSELTGLESANAAQTEALSEGEARIAILEGDMTQSMSAVDALETELLSRATQAQVDGIETRLTGAEQKIDENAAVITGIDARVAVHRASFTGESAADSGSVAGRSLSFTKTSAMTGLSISYYDNVRVIGMNACRWEVQINGQSCVQPGPVAGTVFMGTGSENNHIPTTIQGSCSATASGPIPAGAVTLSVSVGSAPGFANADCHTGFGGRGALFAQEF